MVSRSSWLIDVHGRFAVLRVFALVLAAFTSVLLPDYVYSAGESDSTISALDYSQASGVIIGDSDGVVVDGRIIPVGYVNDLLVEDDVAWVSSDNGLVGVDLLSVGKAEFPGRFVSSIPTSGVAFGVDGDLWVGTGAYGVMRINADEKCNQFDSNTCTRDWFGVDEGVPNNNVLSILASDDGSVWAGTTTGLGRYSNGVWTKVPHFVDEWIYTIKEYGSVNGSASPLLVGTSTGAFVTTDGLVWDVLDATKGRMVASMLEVGEDLVVATENNLIRYPHGDFSNPVFSREDYLSLWRHGVTAMTAPTDGDEFVVLGFRDGERVPFKEDEWMKIWDVD